MSTTTSQPRLVVHTAPFLRQGVTTPRLMGDVLLSLVPVLIASVWVFGLSSLLVVGSCVAGAVGTEWLVGRRSAATSLGDGSAVVTGVLLGLTLPAGFPMWMAAVGGITGVGLGKLVWGGLGDNLFNPALVGRAFLQAAFPVAITTWSPPQGVAAVRASNFAIPLLQAPVDALSGATPLNRMKFAGEGTPLADLLLGNVSGSLGETSAAAILLAAAFLVARRACDWRVPVGILASVAAVSGGFHLFLPERVPGPGFMLLSGGLLFGAVFMATDPVTSPLSPRGSWIFAAGIGIVVVLIRVWGGLPEGVMYAILLGNAVTPLLERVSQPRAFGRRKSS